MRQSAACASRSATNARSSIAVLRCPLSAIVITQTMGGTDHSLCWYGLKREAL